MAANTFGRIPVTVIQIDQDLCCKVYAGTNACGTCNADEGQPCYNTFATCQSKEDYALGDPLTLSFSMPQTDQVCSEYLIPSVTGVNTEPGRINVAGRNSRDKPLGKRAKVSVRLTDHPHSDNFVDPYLSQRNFVPFDRGTFWGKWLKRNPFYNGRPLRVLEGFAGQTLAEMDARHYVINAINGPDSRGNVTIIADDILALADDKKAQAPALSTGVLLADIDETATTLTVTGGALSQYNSYSTSAIRIGDEVIRYTGLTVNGSGDLVFTGLTRGSDNTEAQSHDAEDTVQACLEYIQVRADQVAYDILTNFGNIDPDFIDLTEWDEQGVTWLDQFVVTRLITEPVGVTTLIGQLAEQCLFYIWWDDYNQRIRLRAVAPFFGEVPLIDEDCNLLQNSVSVKASPELRANEVWVSYIPKDPTVKGDSNEDFRRTAARLDTELSSVFAYNERQVYQINSPWLINNLQVDLVSFRLLERYKNTPLYIKFDLDLKDEDLYLGDVFDITFKGFTDETGLSIAVRYQVISRHVVDGSVIKYEAQKFDFDVGALFGRWMASDAPTYANATEEQKINGAWWADADGLIDGDDGYTWA